MDHDAELLMLCALDALDPSEESEVRSHVRVCPACREEFIQCCEVVGHLALVTRPVLPPIALRRGLLSAIAQAPGRRAAHLEASNGIKDIHWEKTKAGSFRGTA